MPVVFCLHRASEMTPIDETDLDAVGNTLHVLYTRHGDGEINLVWDIPWRGTFRLYAVWVGLGVDHYITDVMCSARDAAAVARQVVAYSAIWARSMTVTEDHRRGEGRETHRVAFKKATNFHNWSDTVKELAKEEIRNVNSGTLYRSM